MIGSTGYEASHVTAIDTRILKSDKVKKASEVINRRCGRCHEGVRNLPKHPADWGQGTKLIQPQRAWKIKQKDNKAVWRYQQHIIYNLTHPEQSIQLLAPLSKEAGGYGICRAVDSGASPSSDTQAPAPVEGVFEGPSDPDYQILLAAIEDAKALHDSDPRWDTPGWKAPPEYVREMKRHGILPETFDRDKDPLDPHEIDQKYWRAVTGRHLPGQGPELHENPKTKALCIKGTMGPDGSEVTPGAVSLTTGKPVACSTAIAGYPAHLANDGNADDTNRFWAMDVGKGDPAWWQVDLEKPVDVGRVVVVCYYGDNRHYGFTVETSVDGKQWKTVADMRDNQDPSTAEGYTCRFDRRQVRYIKVTQTGNSANTGRHLVEVMAFEQ